MDVETGYEFYNCNIWKSENSISAFCSEEVYSDTQAGREALLSHIMDEYYAGDVEINHEDLNSLRDRILFEDPLSANDLIEYGIIMEKAIY